jgi:hypothetical protein
MEGVLATVPATAVMVGAMAMAMEGVTVTQQ